MSSLSQPCQRLLVFSAGLLTPSGFRCVDRCHPEREGPLGGDGRGSEHRGVPAERQHLRYGGRLRDNQGEARGAPDSREPDEVPEEEEEQVSHTFISEEEQEEEGGEGERRSLSCRLSFKQ